MKKILPIFLIIAIIFSLVACNGANSSTDTQTSTTTENSSQTTSDQNTTNTTTTYGITSEITIDSESTTSITNITSDQNTNDSTIEPTQSDTTPVTEEITGIVPTQMSYMSFNLRYDVTSHALMSEQIRGAHLMEVIDKYMPDSIGFQEATDTWMNFLRNNLKTKNYSWTGVGRDDGKDTPGKTGNGNEHAAIFFRKDLYRVFEEGNFWISDTPQVQSGPAFDASNTRICTYIVLQNKITGEKIAHFNTHTDHNGKFARENAARIITNRILEIIAKYGDIGIVATGDFNDIYESPMYNIMTSVMSDTRYSADEKGVDGNTFCGYQNPAEWEQGIINSGDKPAVDVETYPIDYIFVLGNYFNVNYYTVIDDTFTFEHNGQTWHDHPISDHYGLLAKIIRKSNTDAVTIDESKTISVPAKIYTENALPANSLAGYINLSSDAVASSNLTCKVGGEITKILNKTSSELAILGVNKASSKLFWDITISLNSASTIGAISFTTGSNEANLPGNVEILVTTDGSSWKKVGTISRQLQKDETIYYLFNEEFSGVKKVKFVIVDCPPNTELFNVTVYGTAAEINIYSQNKIEVISGPKLGTNEGCQYLFDGLSSTKYYHNLSSHGPLEPIIFKTESAIVLSGYIITNASDHTTYNGRLAQSWIIYGSTTGEDGTWVAISTITSPGLTETNLAEFEFLIEGNTTAYQYYKFEITQAGTQNRVQISELTLLIPKNSEE